MRKGQLKMQELVDFQGDVEWLSSNKEVIRKEHPDSFIAIKNGKIIATSRDLDTLTKDVKSKGFSPSEIVIEFVPKKEPIFFL